jgi:hypothetical protein
MSSGGMCDQVGMGAGIWRVTLESAEGACIPGTLAKNSSLKFVKSWEKRLRFRLDSGPCGGGVDIASGDERGLGFLVYDAIIQRRGEKGCRRIQQRSRMLQEVKTLSEHCGVEKGPNIPGMKPSEKTREKRVESRWRLEFSSHSVTKAFVRHQKSGVVTKKSAQIPGMVLK